MKNKFFPSLNAMNGLKKLGSDISAARKRRKFTQQRLADGAGVTLPTIRRLEKGNPGVSLATLAMVLVVLGEGKRLANLLDIGGDDVGLLLENQQLPQRVRSPRRKPPTKVLPSPDTPAPTVPHHDDDIGEAF